MLVGIVHPVVSLSEPTIGANHQIGSELIKCSPCRFDGFPSWPRLGLRLGKGLEDVGRRVTDVSAHRGCVGDRPPPMKRTREQSKMAIVAIGEHNRGVRKYLARRLERRHN